MSYTVMACVVMAYVVMAYAVMACVVMAYVVMAYAVMAYAVLACVVMAYVVMAYANAQSTRNTSPRARARLPCACVHECVWVCASARLWAGGRTHETQHFECSQNL